MIHGCSIFSMADLNNTNTYLYGKYKYRKIIYDVECLEEIEDYTNCRIKGIDGGSDDYKDIKTSKIYDVYHSIKKEW